MESERNPSGASRARPQASPAGVRRSPAQPVPAQPSPSTSTASRVAVSAPLVAREGEHAREAKPCRWHRCTENPEKGFVFCPDHEKQWAADKTKHEPETDERQFVRYAYAEDCKLPYRPRSIEAKPKRADNRPPINRVLDALLSAGCSYRASTSDVDSWQSLCPTHEDRSPSLHVKRNHDGTVWIKCWAGCAKEGILSALGLEWRDLWEDNQHDAGRKKFVKPFLPSHLRNAMVEALRLDDERRAA